MCYFTCKENPADLSKNEPELVTRKSIHQGASPQPGLQNKIRASLCYMVSPHCKKKKKTTHN